MSRSTPLTLLSLNQDVLSYVVGHLSPRDAVSLSSTCRAANTIPVEPSLHTVVLRRSITQIKKLRDYLLKADFRYNLLKSLTLLDMSTSETDHDFVEAAGALADILERTPNLECFSSSVMEDLVHASQGRVFAALASLENLYELNVSQCGSEILQAILSLPLKTHKLRSFTAKMQFEVGYTEHGVCYDALLSTLQQHPHLESLSLSLDGAVSRMGGPWSLPTVTALTLEDTFIPMSIAATIFPGVRRLTFRSAGAAQFVERGTAVPSWNALEAAHMDASDLALWPLWCPVRALRVDMLTEVRARAVVLAVERTTPYVFACTYRVDTVNQFWKRVPAVAHNLRFLEVRAVEHSKGPRGYMLQHVANFPILIAIDMCIHAYYIPGDLDAELIGIAHDLAKQNHALRFVGVSLVDGRQSDEAISRGEQPEARWWAVERNDTTPPVPLSFEWDPVGGYYGGIRLVDLPMGTGRKVRNFMYETDFGTQGWEEELSAFALV